MNRENFKSIRRSNKMVCSACSQCFSEEEKTKLKEKNWTEEEIKFAEDSIIEDKIKELLK